MDHTIGMFHTCMFGSLKPNVESKPPCLLQDKEDGEEVHADLMSRAPEDRKASTTAQASTLYTESIG